MARKLASKLVIQSRGSVRTIARRSTPTMSPGPYSWTSCRTGGAVTGAPPPIGVPDAVSSTVTWARAAVPGVAVIPVAMPRRSQDRNE
jgi:hypothetical protein